MICMIYPNFEIDDGSIYIPFICTKIGQIPIDIMNPTINVFPHIYTMKDVPISHEMEERIEKLRNHHDRKVNLKRRKPKQSCSSTDHSFHPSNGPIVIPEDEELSFLQALVDSEQTLSQRVLN